MPEAKSIKADVQVSETIADRIRRKLEDAFSPTELEIEDQSHRHAGHGGWREGGETHFHVSMTSAAFNGQGRVARQRAVYAALKAELEERVHALGLTLKAPGEG